MKIMSQSNWMVLTIKPTIKTTTLLNCRRRVRSTKTKRYTHTKQKTSTYQQDPVELDEQPYWLQSHQSPYTKSLYHEHMLDGLHCQHTYYHQSITCPDFGHLQRNPMQDVGMIERGRPSSSDQLPPSMQQTMYSISF